MESTSSDAPVVALNGLSKRFGKAWALRGVDLTVRAGEIHALVGENGSGKSTLVKILSGFHSPNEGSLEVAGRPVKLPLITGQARTLGFEFVHQDLGLIPSLPVVDNLRLEEFGTTNRFLLRWGRLQSEVRATLRDYGLEIDPRSLVSTLSPIDRTLIAIVRAAEGLRQFSSSGGSARLLVLDEPTVFLPQSEVNRLFGLVDTLRETGLGVLFVTHNLDEVLEVSQRVTVLRDGQSLGTVETVQSSRQHLIHRITGREHLAEDSAPSRDGASRNGDPTAEIPVQNLTGLHLRGLTFSLRRGKSLGFTGLAGSGFEAIPYLLFGAIRADAGTMHFGNERYDLTKMTPHLALTSGFALVPGDRQSDGIVSDLTLHENVTILDLPQYFRGGRLRRRAMVKDTSSLLQQFGVRPPEPHQVAGILSGGNQQKAVLAKWLHREPKILMCHEPTQGVDVGARSDIHKTLGRLQAHGTALLYASSDHEELASVCDRVLVIHDGVIAAELSGAEVTKERITELCLAASTVQNRP